MSTFNTVIENHLNTTGLKRIRIMYDPSNEGNDTKDYVGYVLEEGEAGHVVAIVPDLGPQAMSFSPDQFSADTPCENDPLGSFKQFIVSHLISKGYQDKVSEHMESIINCTKAEELEKLLIHCGCNGIEGVLDVYRDYVENE